MRGGILDTAGEGAELASEELSPPVVKEPMSFSESLHGTAEDRGMSTNKLLDEEELELDELELEEELDEDELELLLVAEDELLAPLFDVPELPEVRTLPMFEDKWLPDIL